MWDNRSFFLFFSYGCRSARSDLYPLQSHSRSLINNKSTRARKSPEWAGRAGTKKSLRTWRCVMSTPWCLQSSLSSNTVNVKDKQWGLSGASSRASVCAPITPCEKKKKTSPPARSRLNERLAFLNATWKLPPFPRQKHAALSPSGNQSGKQWLDSVWGVFKKWEQASLKGRQISESSRVEEMWKVLNLLW